MSALPLSLSNSRREAILTIEWSDGEHRLSNHLLRTRCRCTECESARRAGKPSTSAEAPVWIVQINPVGTYGAQFVFSDGHERGIFPWTYLRELADRDSVAKSAHKGS